MSGAKSAPVPGGLSTGIGRAAVADPSANPWGVVLIADPASRAAGVNTLAWFSDANVMVSSIAAEVPLWNIDPADEDQTARAQHIAQLGGRMVAGGGASAADNLAFTIPALAHLLTGHATIPWAGPLDDLLTGAGEFPRQVRGEYRGGDGTAPFGEGEREAFVEFLKTRGA